MITFILVLGAFLAGVTAGFMFCQIANASAMNQGIAFFKKGNKWYPYNPFRSQEKG